MLMPCGDGTGPMGLGPGTGRFLGYCAGYPAPGYMNASAIIKVIHNRSR